MSLSTVDFAYFVVYSESIQGFSILVTRDDRSQFCFTVWGLMIRKSKDLEETEHLKFAFVRKSERYAIIRNWHFTLYRSDPKTSNGFARSYDILYQ